MKHRVSNVERKNLELIEAGVTEKRKYDEALEKTAANEKKETLSVLSTNQNTYTGKHTPNTSIISNNDCTTKDFKKKKADNRSKSRKNLVYCDNNNNNKENRETLTDISDNTSKFSATTKSKLTIVKDSQLFGQNYLQWNCETLKFETLPNYPFLGNSNNSDPKKTSKLFGKKSKARGEDTTSVLGIIKNYKELLKPVLSGSEFDTSYAIIENGIPSSARLMDNNEVKQLIFDSVKENESYEMKQEVLTPADGDQFSSEENVFGNVENVGGRQNDYSQASSYKLESECKDSDVDEPEPQATKLNLDLAKIEFAHQNPKKSPRGGIFQLNSNSVEVGNENSTTRALKINTNKRMNTNDSRTLTYSVSDQTSTSNVGTKHDRNSHKFDSDIGSKNYQTNHHRTEKNTKTVPKKISKKIIGLGIKAKREEHRNDALRQLHDRAKPHRREPDDQKFHIRQPQPCRHDRLD
jgi:hypothetical protein